MIFSSDFQSGSISKVGHFLFSSICKDACLFYLNESGFLSFWYIFSCESIATERSIKEKSSLFYVLTSIFYSFLQSEVFKRFSKNRTFRCDVGRWLILGGLGRSRCREGLPQLQNSIYSWYHLDGIPFIVVSLFQFIPREGEWLALG